MSAAVVTEQIYRLTSASRTDVCVDLGRLERLVAEERLDDTQVGTAVEEFGRKGVAEDMRVKPDAKVTAGARDSIDDGPLADSSPRGHKERVAGGQRPSPGEIDVHRLFGDGVERHDAILVPLAPNPQTARFAGIVADAGRDHLASPEAGEGQERQDGAIPGVALGGHGGFGLVPLEHARKMALTLRYGECTDGIAGEVSAIDQPSPKATELDESPAQGIGAPPLCGHVPLVVAEAGCREGPKTIPARRARTAVEQVTEKLGEVAVIGGDGLRGQALLDLAMAKEFAMETRERHGRGLAPGCR